MTRHGQISARLAQPLLAPQTRWRPTTACCPLKVLTFSMQIERTWLLADPSLPVVRLTGRSVSWFRLARRKWPKVLCGSRGPNEAASKHNIATPA
jgi:hypothetical protein